MRNAVVQKNATLLPDLSHSPGDNEFQNRRDFSTFALRV